MRLIVDACGGVLRGIRIGGEGLRVRAGLVVLLDGLRAGCHYGRVLKRLGVEGGSWKESL